MTDTGLITVRGCGMVTPFAADSGERVLAAADNAHCDADSDYWAIPDELVDRYPKFGSEMKRDRSSWITGAALTHACRDASVDLAETPSDKIALVLGTAFAGQLGMIDFATEVRSQSARFVSPIHFPQTVGNYVAGVMSRAFKIQGPNLTIATGPTSGLNAIAKACGLLTDGTADVAIAGGFEVLSDTLVRGLGGSTHGGDHADVWAEGACLYVLERARDDSRRIICEWRSIPGTEDDGGSIAHRVGKSLAAESAMRLCQVMTIMPPNTQAHVTHADDNASITRLVVAKKE